MKICDKCGAEHHPNYFKSQCSYCDGLVVEKMDAKAITEKVQIEMIELEREMDVLEHTNITLHTLMISGEKRGLAKREQEIASLKSTLEATLKTFDERGAALVTLQGMLESMTRERNELADNINLLAYTWRPIFAGKDLHEMFSNAHKENEKMRKALNKVFDEVEPTGKHFCLDCFNVIQKALTPPTTTDNSKDVK